MLLGSLARERKSVLPVIKEFFETFPVNPSFVLYTLDARECKTPEAILQKMNKLFSNQLVREKDTMFAPSILSNAQKALDLDNIDLVPDQMPLQKNVLMGTRIYHSKILPGYDHYIKYIILVLSPYLYLKKDFHTFKSLREFFDVYIPEDETKFMQKARVIYDDPHAGIEKKHFWDLALRVRPKLYQKYRELYREPDYFYNNDVENVIKELI